MIHSTNMISAIQNSALIANPRPAITAISRSTNSTASTSTSFAHRSSSFFTITPERACRNAPGDASPAGSGLRHLGLKVLTERQRRRDVREVREALREIPQHLLGPRVVLLGEQP